MGCLQERLRHVPASSSRPKVHQLLDWAEGGMRACGRTRTSLKLVPETSKSMHANITQRSFDYALFQRLAPFGQSSPWTTRHQPRRFDLYVLCDLRSEADHLERCERRNHRFPGGDIHVGIAHFSIGEVARVKNPVCERAGPETDSCRNDLRYFPHTPFPAVGSVLCSSGAPCRAAR